MLQHELPRSVSIGTTETKEIATWNALIQRSRTAEAAETFSTAHWHLITRGCQLCAAGGYVAHCASNGAALVIWLELRDENAINGVARHEHWTLLERHELHSRAWQSIGVMRLHVSLIANSSMFEHGKLRGAKTLF